MAFLDNSGDIILDAVLTDTGRMRLAKGDGSFKIAKFAFGDDEIVYTSYNKDHSSGSAYYDLEILQTPVLEAFTNNTSTMKSKLISISRTNLLYLPVIKLNEVISGDTKMNATTGSFIVTVDEDTEKTTANSGVFSVNNGIIKGFQPTKGGSAIRVDQGLDTNAKSPEQGLESDLMERQYIIEIDNRLGSIVSSGLDGFSGEAGKPAAMSFLDDDNIASYYLSLGTDPEFVANNSNTSTTDGTQTITGPRGTMLSFKILASSNLQQSDYLFEQLGGTTTFESTALHYLDSTVRITGATTGYRIDVPLRFIKK